MVGTQKSSSSQMLMAPTLMLAASAGQDHDETVPFRREKFRGPNIVSSSLRCKKKMLSTKTFETNGNDYAGGGRRKTFVGK